MRGNADIYAFSKVSFLLYDISCIRSAPAQQIFLKQDEAQLPYSVNRITANSNIQRMWV